jgi:hypothetical protein
VFKKAFQVVVTFGMRVGGYQAYLLGFAALTDRIGAPTTAEAPWTPTKSLTAREATRLAAESFGKDHWSAQDDLKIRYYDAERGFYFYARNYERREGGKKFEFWPFAIVWHSKDGKSRKTGTSERALVELNDAMGLVKPDQAPLHVVEAKLENNVILRDDKGTRADTADDLVVGPLPYIEYTEKTNPPAIRSVSNVRLVDRDMIVTGYDLLILLRKAEGSGSSPAGFDAQTAYLKKNVDIVVKDVGKSNILPGTAKGTPAEGSTPLHLKNEGEMRIDFPPKPKPYRPQLVGPPELEGPTYATFHRLVVVRRGLGALMDELTCDTLRLTLLPSEKQVTYAPISGGGAVILGAGSIVPGAGGVTPSVGRAAQGPLTELAIREANAKGFSVWLTSAAQGMKARCDELIYKKLMPLAADETYLRGNTNRQIFVEKIDRAATSGAEPGPVTSVMNLWSADAKIFDDGKGGTASTVIARGPGRIETRPAADKPADHAATWVTDLVMRTIPLGVAKADGTPAPTERLITLTGDPKLEEFAKAMKLEAKRWVIVSLKPRPKAKAATNAFAANPASTKSADPLGSGSYQIEWMRASQDVRLTSPGKTMVARDELNARFEQVEALASSPSNSNSAVIEEPKLVAEANPAPPAIGGPAFAAKAPEPPAKPAEPDVLVTAHKVWATIHQAEGKSEISEAMLRGQVKFHQDAAPDKKRGTDVAGEALDIKGVGAGKMRFMVFDSEPSAVDGRARLAARGAPNLPRPTLAKIVTEDYAIEGPKIGMDQSIDYAWVSGEGRLTQLAERGFLNDKGVQDRIKAQGRRVPDKEKDKDKAKGETKVPFTIAWTDQMQFFGKATDLEGRPAGKAEFRGNVEARMEDGAIAADEIDTYTNKPVSLASRPKAAANARPARGDDVRPAAVNNEDVPGIAGEPGGDEPAAELAFLDARNAKGGPRTGRNVTAISVKRDPETGQRIEVQRITGERISYDKRTGEYSVPGKGTVYLWRRSAVGPEKAPGLPGGPLPQANRGRAVPIANPTRKPGPTKEYAPWELTKVQFEENMKGRFGVGKDKEESESRTADFYGAVQVITAVVLNEMTDLSFDSHPTGFKRITADSLRIVSEPPPPGVKDVAARTFVTAEKNAQATTETHTVAADILKFDSAKDLFLAYGLDGRDVAIVNQANPGQPSSIIRSEAAYYNHKTGAAQPINPNTIQLLDASAGQRPGPEGPRGPEAAKPRNQRPSLRPPPSSHIERRGFGSSR